MLGLHFCARAFSSCGEWGPLFIAVRGPLTIAASLVVEHRLQTRRLSSCGSRAQLLRGMWDLPRPGLEPVSPALAGRLSTTVPPGKPNHSYFKFPNNYKNLCHIWVWFWSLLCFFRQCLFLSVNRTCNFLVKAKHVVSGIGNRGEQAFGVRFYINLARSWAVFNVCSRYKRLQFPLASLLSGFS